MKKLQYLYLSYLVILFLHLWESFHRPPAPPIGPAGPRTARR